MYLKKIKIQKIWISSVPSSDIYFLQMRILDLRLVQHRAAPEEIGASFMTPNILKYEKIEKSRNNRGHHYIILTNWPMFDSSLTPLWPWYELSLTPFWTESCRKMSQGNDLGAYLRYWSHRQLFYRYLAAVWSIFTRLLCGFGANWHISFSLVFLPLRCSTILIGCVINQSEPLGNSRIHKPICFWAIFNILLWCFISRVFQACGLYLESTF